MGPDGKLQRLNIIIRVQYGHVKKKPGVDSAGYPYKFIAALHAPGRIYQELVMFTFCLTRLQLVLTSVKEKKRYFDSFSFLPSPTYR